MSRFNELPNGDLWVAEPTNPPPAPLGYFQDSKKLYYYHLIIKECEYRFMLKEELCCKNSKNIIYCDELEKEISQIKCKDCIL